MESHPRPTQERINELKKAALSGEIPQGEGSIQSAEERAGQIIEKRNLQEQLARDQAHGEALVEYAKRSQEADQTRHEAAIEERKIKGDVAQLNDLAELEIFGSRGRTYRHPATGEVIADKAHPYKGLLEKMLEEPAELKHRPQPYRNTEAQKREAKAQRYVKDLLRLVYKEGLELCQAKLIMNLREKDDIEKPKLRRKLEEDSGRIHSKNGQPTTPAKKATELYKNLDKERIKTIRNEGVFTLEEYQTAIKGNSLYDGPKEGQSPQEDTPSPKEANDDEQLTEVIEEVSKDGTKNDEKDEESDKEVTPEVAEEKRRKALHEVQSVLAQLREKQSPGSWPARILKPIKKAGRHKSEMIRHPQLLNVRQPALALKNSLTKSVKGHVESGRSNGWIMPFYKKNYVPNPKYFYDSVENAELAPWSDNLVVTPDGRVFYSFVRAEDVFGKKDEKNENGAIQNELALTEDSVKNLSDLSLKELETIKTYLLHHLNPEDEQKTEVLPSIAGVNENSFTNMEELEEVLSQIPPEGREAFLKEHLEHAEREKERREKEEKELREKLGKDEDSDE